MSTLELVIRASLHCYNNTSLLFYEGHHTPHPASFLSRDDRKTVNGLRCHGNQVLPYRREIKQCAAICIQIGQLVPCRHDNGAQHPYIPHMRLDTPHRIIDHHQ